MYFLCTPTFIIEPLLLFLKLPTKLLISGLDLYVRLKCEELKYFYRLNNIVTNILTFMSSN